MTWSELQSEFQLTKNTLSLAWGVYWEDFREHWHHYHGTTLYKEFLNYVIHTHAQKKKENCWEVQDLTFSWCIHKFFLCRPPQATQTLSWSSLPSWLLRTSLLVWTSRRGRPSVSTPGICWSTWTTNRYVLGNFQKKKYVLWPIWQHNIFFWLNFN